MEHFRLRSTNHFLRDLSFIHLLSLIVLFSFYLNRIVTYQVLLCWLTFNILSFFYSFRYHKQMEENLSYLISQTDKMMQDETYRFVPVDGEGKSSILCFKLASLASRQYSYVEKLQQEKKKIKDYVEDISHQIKTPLTSSNLWLDLLLENEKDENTKNKLEKIQESHRHITQLIDDLLKLARLESASIKLEFNHHDFNELIDGALDSLVELQYHQQVKVNSHQEGTIYCDSKWMSEVFVNILKNCMEKCYQGQIDISIKQHEYDTEIVIQDNGPGFNEEDIPHLFDRFYKGNQKTKGVGIGLALAKEIILLHKGTIFAANHHGALFTIRIPVLSTKKKL